MSWTINLLTNPVLLVGVGGAVGSVARYGVGYWLGALTANTTFPLATTIVNLLGSLALGCIAGSVSDRSQTIYLLLGVGFCGGFTTFSTFSLELVDHLQSGRLGSALLECVFNVVLGVCAVYAGLWLCKPQ